MADGRWQMAARRRHKSFARSVVLVAVVAFVFAVSASAASAHYYATATLPGSAFIGVSADARVNNIGINTGSDFLNNEIWAIDGGTWVETGIHKGVGVQRCVTSYPAFFWAEGLPDGSFMCYASVAQASLNTYYQLSLDYLGQDLWITQAGSFSGTTNPVQPVAVGLQGGIETTTRSVHTCTSLSNMSYVDGDGNTIFGWSDSSHGDATLSADNPPYISWVSAPSWQRAWANESC